MKRSELTDAPFNPRRLDDAARRKLKANLKRVGLLQPPVWNRRTGHVVSGHQRLGLLDALEKNRDYLLQVAVIDFDEKTEKEQVVFLNNEFAMGSFDIAKLDALLHEVNFENAGFDEVDLQVMLPSWARPMGDAATEQLEEVKNVVDDIKDHRDPVQEGKDLKQKRRDIIEEDRQRSPESVDVEFFLVVVFKNVENQRRFLERVGVDEFEKYISGEKVAALLEDTSGNLE